MAPFDDIVREFASVEQELNAVPVQSRDRMTQNWDEAVASLKMREGNCYLPKLVPLGWRAALAGHENASLAARAYIAAVKSSDKVSAHGGRRSLTSSFARLSLAQALERLERTHWESWVPVRLYEEVLRDFTTEAVFKTEPVILVQLNYTMAICSARIEAPNQTPATFLVRAREQLQHVPDSTLVFTPINKILLRREQLLAEMELFEKGVRHGITAKAGA